MPQIIQITSEAIQAQIRRLLPSQQGFSIDMEASSVITPVIDITPAAEGSQLATDLQRASSYGSNTFFSAASSTVTAISTPGFHRLIGTSNLQCKSASNVDNYIRITDGTTPKVIWRHSSKLGAVNGEVISLNLDMTVYLNTGESLTIEADSACAVTGSTRQIADLYGNVINPVGFTFE